jgi:hypothetical protein
MTSSIPSSQAKQRVLIDASKIPIAHPPIGPVAHAAYGPLPEITRGDAVATGGARDRLDEALKTHTSFKTETKRMPPTEAAARAHQLAAFNLYEAALREKDPIRIGAARTDFMMASIELARKRGRTKP